MLYTMLRALLTVLTLLFVCPLAQAHAACGNEKVTVEGSEEEASVACDAYAMVADYFAKLGHPVSPSFEVRFETTVHVDGSADGYPVTGLFTPEEHLVEVTALDSTAPARALHWRQPWTRPLARSILLHEFTHAFVDAVLPGQLPQAWNEFVAYAVQFELMDPALRGAILADYPGATAYEDASLVCELGYVLDFDLFGVRAYLTAEAGGGSAYVGRILSREVQTSTPRRYECPEPLASTGTGPADDLF